jgi:hypothetical protein
LSTSRYKSRPHGLHDLSRVQVIFSRVLYAFTTIFAVGLVNCRKRCRNSRYSTRTRRRRKTGLVHPERNMADFLTNLWGSVFTPGATPTLLVATNVTFAALQLLLLTLLIATYSIHFGILSVLCAGLWYSINWFAVELQAAQAKEEEAERIRKTSAANKEKDWKARTEVADSEADDEGEDTETEQGMKDSMNLADTTAERRVREQMKTPMEEGGDVAARTENGAQGKASGAEAEAARGESRQRIVGEGDRSGYVSSSTDSEWEKVEGGR